MDTQVQVWKIFRGFERFSNIIGIRKKGPVSRINPLEISSIYFMPSYKEGGKIGVGDKVTQ